MGDSNNALLAGMGFKSMLFLSAIAGNFFVFLLLLEALGWLGMPRQEHLHQSA